MLCPAVNSTQDVVWFAVASATIDSCALRSRPSVAGERVIEVKFKLNGREVPPERLGDALTAALLQQLKSNVQTKLSSVHCPEHGQQPTVTAEGNSLDQLKWTVRGCYSKLVAQATSAPR